MRTTLNLNDELVKQALDATGANSKTEVIELGLKVLVEREARRRLKLLYARRPDLGAVRRRRS